MTLMGRVSEAVCGFARVPPPPARYNLLRLFRLHDKKKSTHARLPSRHSIQSSRVLRPRKDGRLLRCEIKKRWIDRLKSGPAHSSLPARFEIVNRRIATLSKRKTDPFYDKIMDFGPFLEGGLA
jgi:hypothetical protein